MKISRVVLTRPDFWTGGLLRNSWTIGVMALALAAAVMAHADVNVTQYHNHLSRDGLFIDPAFTTANAAGLKRDTNFNGTIIGDSYAQPLYIEGGPRGRAVVIAVTESNFVYALDAARGTVVWQTNLVPPIPSGVLLCGDILPYGITGTPVVDLPTRTLYLDAVTVKTNNFQPVVTHLVYGLNVDTGEVVPGWPVDVNSNAVSEGIEFNSLSQGERGALAVIGTNLYIPYGGLAGDCGTYHGWIVGISTNNPTNIVAWATPANGGGAWAVGGVASDGVDPFLATGNTFFVTTWGGGEAIVHFQSDLKLGGLTNYWAPTNWNFLDMHDTDIGGSGPLLVDVPGATPSQLIVSFGKDGNVYLLNRTNLGGIGAALAQAHVAGGPIIQGATAYTTLTNGTYVAFRNGTSVTALRILPTSPPGITTAWTASEGGGGSPFATSTDGSNNVVVWGIGTEGDGKLHGFDADHGTAVFTGGGGNETMANARRFTTAMAARGRIYYAALNKVYAFRAPNQVVTSITLTNAVALPTGGLQFGFTNIAGALFNVYATTNISDSFTNWDWLGEPAEVSPGQFQFTDPAGADSGVRYYRVSSP
jgi:hypothetical protein